MSVAITDSVSFQTSASVQIRGISVRTSAPSGPSGLAILPSTWSRPQRIAPATTSITR